MAVGRTNVICCSANCHWHFVHCWNGVGRGLLAFQLRFQVFSGNALLAIGQFFGRAGKH